MNFINALLSSVVGFITALVFMLANFTTVVLNTLLPPTPIVITPQAPSPTIFPEASGTVATTTNPIEVPPKKIVTPSPASNLLLDVNGLARSAVVNILCSGGTIVPSVSGSGVFIDQRGVILTNAHLGQFFLLHGYSSSMNCVIRTGSPARRAYYASVLYLPPEWINENASKINSKEPTGTGEFDYAFLLITNGVDGTSLPSSFPAISYTTSEPHSGDPMLLAAYPAGFLNDQSIVSNLLVSSSFTVVKQLYTFNDAKTVDLFSIGSTSIAYNGSSGGAAVRAVDGKVTGIITLATDAALAKDRDLRAISTAYINRHLHLREEGGIAGLLSGNLSTKADTFMSSNGQDERQKLIDQIEK